MTKSPEARRQRGKPLITRILGATLVEMARVGYEHLSIEEVAARAGVNKTTIYRRWATPDELALSALESASHRGGLPDTGSLQGDLIAYLTGFQEICQTPALRSLARLQFSGQFDSKLGALVEKRVSQAKCDALLMFDRAAERGELRPDINTTLLRDFFLGGSQSLILFQQQELSPEQIQQVVSIALVGALNSVRDG